LQFPFQKKTDLPFLFPATLPAGKKTGEKYSLLLRRNPATDGGTQDPRTAAVGMPLAGEERRSAACGASPVESRTNFKMNFQIFY
jgi:hypothetical protein